MISLGIAAEGKCSIKIDHIRVLLALKQAFTGYATGSGSMQQGAVG
jgi:hypothetical protein